MHGPTRRQVIRVGLVLAATTAGLGLPSRGTAGDPIPWKAVPATGSPGAVLLVTITGDNLGDVSKCDFGSDIEVSPPKVINTGELIVGIKIKETAGKGLRDVKLTDKAGKTGTLPKGFEVK